MPEVLKVSQQPLEVAYEVPCNIIVTQELLEIGYLAPPEWRVSQAVTEVAHSVPGTPWQILAKATAHPITVPANMIVHMSCVSAVAQALHLGETEGRISQAIVEVAHVPPEQWEISQAIVEIAFILSGTKYRVHFV